MKKQFRILQLAVTFAVLCGVVLLPHLSFATVCWNGPCNQIYKNGNPTNGTTSLMPGEVLVPALVIPANPTAKTMGSLTNSVQLNTELNPTPGGKPARVLIGVDTYFSDTTQVYSIPASYAFTPNFYGGLVLPFMSVKNDEVNDSGLGDMVAYAKYRYGDEDTVELQGFLAGQFATGDEQKGLGSGANVISFTGKAIKRWNKYRFFAMGGFNQALNSPVIQGAKITYGGQFNYMGAVETNQLMPNLWFGLRGQGSSYLYTVVDGMRLNDSLQTFDLVPEIKFFTGYDTALHLAVTFPVHTHNNVPNAKDRDITVNFGVFKAF